MYLKEGKKRTQSSSEWSKVGKENRCNYKKINTQNPFKENSSHKNSYIDGTEIPLTAMMLVTNTIKQFNVELNQRKPL